MHRGPRFQPRQVARRLRHGAAVHLVLPPRGDSDSPSCFWLTTLGVTPHLASGRRGVHHPGEPGPSLPVSVVDGAPAACTIDLSVRGTISPCTFAYATPSRLTVTGLYVELVGDCGHRSVGCWTGRGVMPLHHACGTIRPGLCGSRSQKRRLSEP